VATAEPTSHAKGIERRMPCTLTRSAAVLTGAGWGWASSTGTSSGEGAGPDGSADRADSAAPALPAQPLLRVQATESAYPPRTRVPDTPSRCPRAPRLFQEVLASGTALSDDGFAPAALPGPWSARQQAQRTLLGARAMSTDQNLLFGVLALQADLLDAPRFAEACSAWAARKDLPLAD